MMDECKHPSFRGCDSDPNTTGILRRSTYKHCTGATDPLYLGELISKKNCQSCSDALIAGPQVRSAALFLGSPVAYVAFLDMMITSCCAWYKDIVHAVVGLRQTPCRHSVCV